MKKLTLSLLFLFLFLEISANDSIKKQFTTLNKIDKVTFFRNLNEKQKTENRVFFSNYFEKSRKESINNFDELKKTEYCIGILHQLNDKHLDAISIFKSLAEKSDYNLSDRERMDIYVAMQESYLKLNLYSKVLDINKKINLLIANGSEYPLWSYNIQSRLYLQLNEYDKAITQLQKEIAILYKNPKRDSLIIPSAYNDLGYYNYLKGDLPKALYCFNNAIKIAKKGLLKNDAINYNNIYLAATSNIAKTKLKQGNFLEVINIITSDLLPKALKEDNEALLDFKILLAEAYLGANDLESSKIIINEIEATCCNSNILLKRTFLLTKIKYYEKAKDESNAYKYFKELNKINDSLNLERQKKTYLSTELNYFIDEKEKEVIQKNEVIEQKEKIVLLVTIFGLLIVLLISFIFVKNNRKKRIKIEQMNASILEKNNTIETSLKEKNLLLKEIHHRVKNNLQIISGILELQNNFIADINVKAILNEGQNRIQAIALLHKTMYQNENFNAVNFEIYLNELITHIKRTNSNPEKDISLSIKTNNVNLNIDTAIPISLIINEALNNCYKHAFIDKNKGNIQIELKKEDEFNYLLIIEDDGIGMPNTININSTNTIGLDLIKGLSSQLKGKIVITNDNGTRILISFKAQNDKF